MEEPDDAVEVGRRDRSRDGGGRGGKSRGQPERALAYFRAALAIERSLDDRNAEASTCGEIAHCHQRAGRREAAHTSFAEALEAARSGPFQRAESVDGLEALRNIGGNLWLIDNAILSDVRALGGVESVGEEVDISENPELPENQAEWPVYTAIGEENIAGDITIEDNGGF